MVGRAHRFARFGGQFRSTLGVDITPESRRISTFTFELPEPVDVVPGGYAVFDFPERLKTGYQHMNDRWPQSLNDDRVRTYAVSKISPDRRQASITVAKAGLVSSYLHTLKSPAEPFEATIKGFGGTFTCSEGGQAVPHMLWVAGGVGITPFLAMYRALRESGRPMPQIDLAYACRLEEVNLLRALAGVRVRLFDSKAHAAPAGDAAWQFYRRRMEAADFSDDTPLARATVFVCGPDALMANVTSWLEGRVEPGRLRLERLHA